MKSLLFLAWETQIKTLSFTLGELCRFISIAGIFSAELLCTSLSKTGPGQHPPILILILSSLQWGAESRMALEDILGRLGTAEGWQRRSFAQCCAELSLSIQRSRPECSAQMLSHPAESHILVFLGGDNLRGSGMAVDP